MLKKITAFNKRNRILFILFFSFIPAQSQTIVQVMVNQPAKFEILNSDTLFTRTDNTYFLGKKLSIVGGTIPYQYSWLKNNLVIGTTPVLEVPASSFGGTYTLIVKDKNNCTLSLVATGTDDILAGLSRISVYPVPASRYININPYEIEEILYVSIINNSGITVLEKRISGETRLEIDLPPGIYYVKIENSSREIVGLKKIIVS